MLHQTNSFTAHYRFLSFLCISILFLTSYESKAQVREQTGIASYYADSFHGRPTASGEIYNKNDYTAAHRTLPFGTRVKVSRIDNGRFVYVKINDRGPETPRRIIDLSHAAAQSLGMLRAGEVRVELEIYKNEASEGEGLLVEDMPLKPQPNGQQDLSSLPLVDYNGEPINTGSRMEQESEFAFEEREREVVSYEEEDEDFEEAFDNPEEEEVPLNPEIAKYTPQLFYMQALKKEADGFGVQVGAYFSFYRLLEALDELRRRGVNESMVQSSSKEGNPMFRIIVGPFNSRAEANKAKQDLAKKKYKGITVNLAELN